MNIRNIHIRTLEISFADAKFLRRDRIFSLFSFSADFSLSTRRSTRTAGISSGIISLRRRGYRSSRAAVRSSPLKRFWRAAVSSNSMEEFRQSSFPLLGLLPPRWSKREVLILILACDSEEGRAEADKIGCFLLSFQCKRTPVSLL